MNTFKWLAVSLAVVSTGEAAVTAQYVSGTLLPYSEAVIEVVAAGPDEPRCGIGAEEQAPSFRFVVTQGGRTLFDSDEQMHSIRYRPTGQLRDDEQQRAWIEIPGDVLRTPGTYDVAVRQGCADTGGVAELAIVVAAPSADDREAYEHIHAWYEGLTTGRTKTDSSYLAEFVSAEWPDSFYAHRMNSLEVVGALETAVGSGDSERVAEALLHAKDLPIATFPLSQRGRVLAAIRDACVDLKREDCEAGASKELAACCSRLVRRGKQVIERKE